MREKRLTFYYTLCISGHLLRLSAQAFHPKFSSCRNFLVRKPIKKIAFKVIYFLKKTLVGEERNAEKNPQGTKKPTVLVL